MGTQKKNRYIERGALPNFYYYTTPREGGMRKKSCKDRPRTIYILSLLPKRARATMYIYTGTMRGSSPLEILVYTQIGNPSIPDVPIIKYA